jgi:hypothetical protein
VLRRDVNFDITVSSCGYLNRHVTSDDDRAAALTHCISSLCGSEYKVKLNEP